MQAEVYKLLKDFRIKAYHNASPSKCFDLEHTNIAPESTILRRIAPRGITVFYSDLPRSTEGHQGAPEGTGHRRTPENTGTPEETERHRGTPVLRAMMRCLVLLKSKHCTKPTDSNNSNIVYTSINNRNAIIQHDSQNCFREPNHIHCDSDRISNRKNEANSSAEIRTQRSTNLNYQIISANVMEPKVYQVICTTTFNNPVGADGTHGEGGDKGDQSSKSNDG